MLSSRLHNLEESNSSIKDNIKDISDRLQITESNNKSLKLTTVEFSEKVSKVYESVENLHKSSSTIMSNYQNQQASIDSLTNIVTTLQEKSAQVVSHSTPKPPPGLPHRNIANTSFFIPKPPPGFHTHAFMPLQREILLSQADFCLEENHLALQVQVNFHLFLSVVSLSQIFVMRYRYLKLTWMEMQIHHRFLQLQPSQQQFVLLTQFLQR